MRSLIDGEALDWVIIHSCVGSWPRIGSTCRDNDADRRLGLLHEPDLVRRCMGAEEHLPPSVGFPVDPECVPHVTRRVIGRDAERLEVIPVPLDFRPFGDLEAHAREGGEHVAHGLSNGVQAPPRCGEAGEGDVQAFGFDDTGDERRFQFPPAGFIGGLEADLQIIRLAAQAAALLNVRQRPKTSQHKGEVAFPAQVRYPPVLEGCDVHCSRERGARG
jgi:hypothetical protein